MPTFYSVSIIGRRATTNNMERKKKFDTSLELISLLIDIKMPEKYNNNNKCG